MPLWDRMHSFIQPYLWSVHHVPGSVVGIGNEETLYPLIGKDLQELSKRKKKCRRRVLCYHLYGVGGRLACVNLKKF